VFGLIKKKDRQEAYNHFLVLALQNLVIGQKDLMGIEQTVPSLEAIKCLLVAVGLSYLLDIPE
jgi:hypothetical protein